MYIRYLVFVLRVCDYCYRIVCNNESQIKTHSSSELKRCSPSSWTITGEALRTEDKNSGSSDQCTVTSDCHHHTCTQYIWILWTSPGNKHIWWTFWMVYGRNVDLMTSETFSTSSRWFCSTLKTNHCISWDIHSTQKKRVWWRCFLFNFISRIPNVFTRHDTVRHLSYGTLWDVEESWEGSWT